MATPATGELRRLSSGWEARIRIEGKRREAFNLTAIGVGDAAGAKERCEAMAKIAVQLRRAGHVARATKLLEEAAKARAGRAWEQVLVAIEALCTEGGATPIDAAAPVVTVEAFADEWTSGRVASSTRAFPTTSRRRTRDATKRSSVSMSLRSSATSRSDR